MKRVALAFGMANPEVMLKGRFLNPDDQFSANEGDTVYVRDERLAAPIALNIKISEN